MTLLTPNTILTSLVLSLQDTISPPRTSYSNPLTGASSATKSLLLTLHCIFPNDLLPALDVLDRQLVTRLVLPPPTKVPEARGAVDRSDESCLSKKADVSPPSASIEIEITDRQHPSGDVRAGSRTAVYYVRSSQEKRGRSKHSLELPPSYEVRLGAWNCSCPAFVFAAFSGMVVGEAEEDKDDGIGGGSRVGGEGEGRETWRFGETRRKKNIPVCKHMLACVLVEKCTVFKEFMEEEDVGRDNMMGWAAGWG